MITLKHVRLVAAIALLCSICLPLGQCSSFTDTHHQIESFSHKLFPHDSAPGDYLYGYMLLFPCLFGLINLLAFTYPVVTILIGRYIPKRFGSIGLPLLEIFLCCISMAWLNYILLAATLGFGRYDLLYGGYIYIGANIIFGFTAIYNLLRLGRTALKPNGV